MILLPGTVLTNAPFEGPYTFFEQSGLPTQRVESLADGPTT